MAKKRIKGVSVRLDAFKDVKSLEELKAVIGSSKDVKVEGIYPGGSEIFEYPLSLDDTTQEDDGQ